MILASSAMSPTTHPHITSEWRDRPSLDHTGRAVAMVEVKVLEVDESCKLSDVTYHTAPHNRAQSSISRDLPVRL